MSPQSHLDYTIRGLLVFCNTVLCRLPGSYNVSVDRDAFIGSFMASPSDEEIRPTPWNQGPNGLVRNIRDQSGPLMSAIADYANHLYPEAARGNPYLPTTYASITGESAVWGCRPSYLCLSFWY